MSELIIAIYLMGLFAMGIGVGILLEKFRDKGKEGGEK